MIVKDCDEGITALHHRCQILKNKDIELHKKQMGGQTKKRKTTTQSISSLFKNCDGAEEKKQGGACKNYNKLQCFFGVANIRVEKKKLEIITIKQGFLMSALIYLTQNFKVSLQFKKNKNTQKSLIFVVQFFASIRLHFMFAGGFGSFFFS